MKGIRGIASKIAGVLLKYGFSYCVKRGDRDGSEKAAGIGDHTGIQN